MKSENVPNDEPVGRHIWSGGGEGPLTTARADLLAAGLGGAAAGGTLLLAPFLGLVTGAVAIPFGRARQRFDDGRRGR